MTRVLALIPGGVSEQLLFFPTLEQLYQNYEPITIDVIVEPEAKTAYRLSTIVDKVITFNFSGRTGPADWGNLIGIGRDREYDAVLYTGRSPFVGGLLWLMGIPQRLAFTDQGADFLYTHVVPRIPQQYIAHQYHSLLQSIRIDAPCPALQITVPESDQDWAQAECQRLGFADKQAFGVIHGGLYENTSPIEIYPFNNWQSLIQGIQDRQPDLPLMVIADPQNPGWTVTLMNQIGGLMVSVPQNLGELAALLNRAQVVICPNSTPMHLAVAMQTKIVALFGSHKPEQQLPPHDHYVGLKAASGNIADIPPIQVLEALQKLLKQ